MIKIDFTKIQIHERPNGSILFCESAAVFKPFTTIKRRLVGNKIEYYRDGVHIKDLLKDKYMREYLLRSSREPIRNIPKYQSICDDLALRIVDVFAAKINEDWFPGYKGYVTCYQTLLKPTGDYTYIPVDIFHKTTSEKQRNKIICQLRRDKAPYKLIIEMSGLSERQIYNICNKNRRRKICIK